MKLRIAITLLIASVLATGVGQAAPRASKSKYLQTTAGGISISRGEKPLFYSLTLSVRKKLDSPLYVRSLFERPGEPEEPLIAESMISPGDEALILESPQFQGIENDETYTVTVILFEDSEHQKEVSRHKQDIHFRVQSAFFEKLGLERP